MPTEKLGKVADALADSPLRTQLEKMSKRGR